MIAVEECRPKFLAKTTMARKAADAAIGATKRALVEMGRTHGREIVLVNPDGADRGRPAVPPGRQAA